VLAAPLPGRFDRIRRIPLPGGMWQVPMAVNLFVERADQALLGEAVTDLIRQQALEESGLCTRGEREETH
jgi:hypothetical protein